VLTQETGIEENEITQYAAGLILLFSCNSIFWVIYLNCFKIKKEGGRREE
jgi:hypothetical protein